MSVYEAKMMKSLISLIIPNNSLKLLHIMKKQEVQINYLKIKVKIKHMHEK